MHLKNCRWQVLQVRGAEQLHMEIEKIMNREMDMAEVSDGKLYGLDDMVKADCAGCEGCHACCTGMGTSVVLDPLTRTA